MERNNNYFVVDQKEYFEALAKLEEKPRRGFLTTYDECTEVCGLDIVDKENNTYKFELYNYENRDSITVYCKKLVDCTNSNDKVAVLEFTGESVSYDGGCVTTFITILTCVDYDTTVRKAKKEYLGIEEDTKQFDISSIDMNNLDIKYTCILSKHLVLRNRDKNNLTYNHTFLIEKGRLISGTNKLNNNIDIIKAIHSINEANVLTLSTILWRDQLPPYMRKTNIDAILFNLNDYVPKYDNEHVAILGFMIIQDIENDCFISSVKCIEEHISVYEAREKYLK